MSSFTLLTTISFLPHLSQIPPGTIPPGTMHPHTCSRCASRRFGAYTPYYWANKRWSNKCQGNKPAASAASGQQKQRQRPGNCPGISHSRTLIFLKQVFPRAAEKWVDAQDLEHCVVWGYCWGMALLLQTNGGRTAVSTRLCFIRLNTMSALCIRAV